MSEKKPFEIISDEELSDAIENDSGESNFKAAAELLYNACNDWPTMNLSEPVDLLKELKAEVNGRLTYFNLERFKKGLDVIRDGWKAEALCSLLEMFDFDWENELDENIELDVIVDKITKHYRRR